MNCPKQPAYFCFFLLLSFLSRVTAQTSNADSQAIRTGYAAAVGVYHRYLAPESRLYKGPEYADYAYTIRRGHPFFDIDHMQKGSLFYNGLFYPDIALIYDLVRGQVVINDPYNAFKIALVNEHLDSFTIGDHRFVHLRDSAKGSLRPGFYEQLYHGNKVSLLKMEKKTIQEDPSATTADTKQYITSSATYYLRIGNGYSTVNTKRSLLRAMKDNKAGLKKYIRSLGLDMQTDKDRIFAQAVAWYDRNAQ